MRLALTFLVVVLGANIGINAIRAVNDMQDSKLERFCQQIPVGASYDEMCARFKK